MELAARSLPLIATAAGFAPLGLLLFRHRAAATAAGLGPLGLLLFRHRAAATAAGLGPLGLLLLRCGATCTGLTPRSAASGTPCIRSWNHQAGACE
jgi:hypothetical protein